jgi:hypothetical protein
VVSDQQGRDLSRPEKQLHTGLPEIILGVLKNWSEADVLSEIRRPYTVAVSMKSAQNAVKKQSEIERQETRIFMKKQKILIACLLLRG